MPWAVCLQWAARPSAGLACIARGTALCPACPSAWCGRCHRRVSQGAGTCLLSVCATPTHPGSHRRPPHPPTPLPARQPTPPAGRRPSSPQLLPRPAGMSVCCVSGKGPRMARRHGAQPHCHTGSLPPCPLVEAGLCPPARPPAEGTGWRPASDHHETPIPSSSILQLDLFPLHPSSLPPDADDHAQLPAGARTSAPLLPRPFGVSTYRGSGKDPAVARRHGFQPQCGVRRPRCCPMGVVSPRTPPRPPAGPTGRRTRRRPLTRRTAAPPPSAPRPSTEAPLGPPTARARRRPLQAPIRPPPSSLRWPPRVGLTCARTLVTGQRT